MLLALILRAIFVDNAAGELGFRFRGKIVVRENMGMADGLQRAVVVISLLLVTDRSFKIEHVPFFSPSDTLVIHGDPVNTFYYSGPTKIWSSKFIKLMIKIPTYTLHHLITPQIQKIPNDQRRKEGS